MSEINRIAAEFLARHLHENPEAQLHRLVCPVRRYQILDSHETAVEFLAQVEDQGITSERIEVTEPETVIVVRSCPRHLPRFLAGTRRDGVLIWAHELRLAKVFTQEEAPEVVKALEAQRISVFVLPAPEPRPWSL